MPKKPQSFRIPQQLIDEIERIASASGQSKSFLVVQMLSSALESADELSSSDTSAPTLASGLQSLTHIERRLAMVEERLEGLKEVERFAENFIYDQENQRFVLKPESTS